MKIAIIGSRSLSVDNLENYIPDGVIAFWDGISSGTDHVIQNCKKLNKDVTVHTIK